MKLSLPARGALVLIGFYRRFISPLTPPSCRFEPTCSHYTYAAIERFGVLRGGWLGMKRICRCNPWHVGGDDPVPKAPDEEDAKSRLESKDGAPV